MKTGFNLYTGDYIPNDGFSAQIQPKTGKLISFDEYIEELLENRDRPCLVIGQAGSGKTTLLKGLANTLIQREGLGLKNQSALLKCFGGRNKDFNAVFYVNIRDLPTSNNASLAQILFSPSVIVDLTSDEAQHGLAAILKNDINIIILLDGLDQASWNPDASERVGPWDKSSTAKIFGNILSGHLLPEIPIVISSREHFVACLPEDMRPQFVNALVGFSEQDAMHLYTEVMGDGAHKDWNELKTTNPRMMYMCLTPLFLTFYMIVKTSHKDVTPDCASGVMVAIIEILRQTRHMKSNVTKVISKLKPMAFQGTKEQRVVFEVKDLANYEIDYTTVNEIIIRVADSTLGQRILEGMHRFFFCHQTLQEILCAIHAAEKPLEDFKAFVDEELHKDYWSVVRCFLCGILKNPKVREGINDEIFKCGMMEI